MLTFVTGNPEKAKQLSLHFHREIVHQNLDLEEIQSLSLEEIISHKAKEAYMRIGSPVLVEDTALTFEVLGKLPGPLIKWFLSELDNDGLCTLLDGYTSRDAIAETLLGYYDGHTLHTFKGEMTMEEQIATSMRRQALQKFTSFLEENNL